jgi:hypothetical protein
MGYGYTAADLYANAAALGIAKGASGFDSFVGLE